ncbi:MAG: alkylphosphonate utilization protein, partial [Rhodobacteraceae bacterium]|nr:alkylphosphonate utilization protein [Paracoccaceae bacterium]
MDIKLVNGTTLLEGELCDEAISIEDGYISQENCIEVDLAGYYLLPGIIDLHGDAFEKHIAPRPSARFDTELALNAIDKDLAANGITTGWMALNWSWEGGRRGPEQAFRFAEALTNYNERSNTDIRIQIRCET